MNETAQTIVRPSLKFIQAGFAAVVIVIVAALVAQYTLLPAGQPPWLPTAASLLIVWPLSRLIRRQFSKVVISGDKLYFETGAIAKQTRIIQIPRIQDVRVHQTITQRLTGVGNLSIETAGETSRLTIPSIDNPRQLAETLLALVTHDPNHPHL